MAPNAKKAVTAALLVTSSSKYSSGFVSTVRHQHRRISSHSPLSPTSKSYSVLRASSENDEVATLMAAAAKAREEARQIAAELGKDFDKDFAGVAKKSNEVVKKQDLSAEEICSSLSSVKFEDISSVSKLDDLTSSGILSLWKAASGSRASPGLSVTEPYAVSLSSLESRSGGVLTPSSLGIDGEMDVNLDDFKDATIAVVLAASVGGVASLVFLPDNIGATLCYFFALLPILWIGVGSSAPGILAGLIQTVRGGNDGVQERLDRVCRHEAGHFLCGYLCGLPIRSYSIDDATGVPRVEFHSGFDSNLSRELLQEEVAALSVVALSGSVAEATNFDRARGGENDLLELQNVFRRSEEFIGASKQQDWTRWGALTSFLLLKKY